MSTCPFHSHATNKSQSNRDWWPEQLKLEVLTDRGDADPLGDFDYRAAFKSLDYDALKSDLAALMTDSQDWWPADYGHYGPLFVRMAWHAAGTYRVADGRGGGAQGTQRFAPLNSWPDNGNLDKARRLLWPVKKKFGKKISWADLILLAGNVALETMGLETFGFAGGRADVFVPEDINWGAEAVWLAGERGDAGEGDLDDPLGAVQMGLIYVNPEGPGGNPDPVLSGKDIRETFARMAMDDEETVALVAGGHTFGKAHGAGDPALVGPEPEAAPMQNMGLGWMNSFASGKGPHTTTSGVEGAWKPNPTTWDMGYFDVLFGYEWELSKSPAGAHQWHPIDCKDEHMVDDAHDAAKKHRPMMTTADMALKMDPIYAPISRKFHKDPAAFADAFARAWFKLLHRDLGPRENYLGPEAPSEVLLWQDNVSGDAIALADDDVAALKTAVLDKVNAGNVNIGDLVFVAWASASTYRRSDQRGGADGARIALEPQRSWACNQPARLEKVLGVLEDVRAQHAYTLADIIVLAGAAAIEYAAKAGGHKIEVPFASGRRDATQAETDVDSFKVLEPVADGFRNYKRADVQTPGEVLLVDKAELLGLSAPEMCSLVGGLRALGVSENDAGVFTARPGVLSNDVFVALLEMNDWQPSGDETFTASGRTATRVDLVMGSNSELRALAEVFASDDGEADFVATFVRAWAKVCAY